MKSIVCGECFRAAFIDGEGRAHHGSVDQIDSNLDADHTAIDVESIPFALDGPERMLQRWQAADDAFASVDFGGIEVEHTGEWEGVTPGTDLSRVIQFIGEDGSSTQRARLVVRFRDFASAEVADVFLTTVDDTDSDGRATH
jgi:hypothetical protein